jgi:ribosomal-protein-alanine N-acetyltransferase
MALEWWSGGTAVIEPAINATPRLAQLHGASFHRGWGEGEFEVMLTERNTLVHRLRRGRKIIGFCGVAMAADEAELLSIAIDATQRGRGLSRNLLLTHLGHLWAAAYARCSSRSKKIIAGAAPAEWAGFEVLAAGNAIISNPAASNECTSDAA